MTATDILLNEYNNLWNEKLIHKQSIRKFHNYLTYLTAIGSLALTFYGVSTTDIFKLGADPQTTTLFVKHARDIVNLVFVPFAPLVVAPHLTVVHCGEAEPCGSKGRP